MKLIDQLDPDQWMAAGNNLMDYHYPPPQGSDRQFIIRTMWQNPELAWRVGTWQHRCIAAGMAKGAAGTDKIADFLSEADVREIWAEVKGLQIPADLGKPG